MSALALARSTQSQRDLVRHQPSAPGEYPTIRVQLDEIIERVTIECVAFDAFAQSQLQLQTLEPALVGIETLTRGFHGLTASHEIDVAIGRAHVPEATSVAVRVARAPERLVLTL